jgi:hypothetical protein
VAFKFGSVSTSRIADDAITSAKIATDAVDSAEIKAAAVDSAELASGAAAANIGSGGVTAAMLASGAAASNLGSGNVTAAMLASGAAASNLAGGTIAGSLAVTGDLTVTGSTTTTIAETVQIQDHNIQIDSNNSTSGVVDGAGITMDGGSGDDLTLQWNATSTRLELKQGSSFADLKVGTLVGSMSGSADELTTARAISLSGDASGSVNFDGSADVTISTTLATVPVAKGGTGATSAPMVGVITAANAGAARTVLGVDASGTDNSTAVTLASVSSNYLSLSGQEITAGTVPTSLGGTGATSVPMVGLITAADAAAARSVLDVDDKGTDNSTDVTLASVSNNYLSLSGQQITAGTVPTSLGGTGATSVPMVGLITAADAAAARSVLDVDDKGTDNSTDVTLATVSGNYLGLSGQQITAGTVPVTLGGTGLTGVSAGDLLYASGSNTLAAAGPGSSSGVQAYSARLDGVKNASLGGLVSGDVAFFSVSSSGSINVQKYNEFDSSHTLKESTNDIFVSGGNSSLSNFHKHNFIETDGASSTITVTLPQIGSGDDGRQMQFAADKDISSSTAVTVKGHGSGASEQKINEATGGVVFNEPSQALMFTARYKSGAGEWILG